MKKRYGLQRVCSTWGLARSTLYYQLGQVRSPVEHKKPGPKPEIDDQTIIRALHEIINERLSLGFHGEGYRKLRAALRIGSATRPALRVSPPRLLRIMRQEGLLSEFRSPWRPQKAHAGRITTDSPDEIWGTDMTSTELQCGRKANVFAVIDHCTQECLGISVSEDATRFSAIEPLRIAVERVYGACCENSGAGTLLRHDCGSAYLSRYFQDEAAYLGLRSSPAFVREPQGNGVVERFFRTVKEQLLWIHRFDTIDALRKAVMQWAENYNSCWMVAKHGYKAPTEVRRVLCQKKAA